MINAHGVRHPKIYLKYAAAALMIVLLAYGTFLISQSWRETKSDQAKQLATIADLSAIAIDTYLTQLHIGMRSLGQDLADTNQNLDLKHAYQLLNRFQELHTELGNVMLIRSDGQVLLTGTTPNNPNLPTLANESAFISFRAELLRGPVFAIGQPVMGKLDNSWAIAARYAITDKTGMLQYIISANFPVNMLQHYWVASTSPKLNALGLIRDDGYLVGHYPEPDIASQDEMYGKPAVGALVDYLRADNYPQAGQVVMRGSDAKAKELLVMRRLQHFPVTLFVTMPMSEIKAAWWDNMHAPYFVMTLLLVCAFTFYSLSARRRRTWSKEQRREELRQRYEQALHERSPNEIFMFDAETLQFTYANDYALENLGYVLAQLQQKTLLTLQPELGIESFGTMIEPLRRGEQESIKYQTVQVRENGSRYPVEVNLHLITSSDETEEFLAISNDVSSLQQAEENLKAFNAPVERRTSKRKKK